MYAKTILLLAATASASIINARMPLGAMDARSIAQGWSLQAATCPANSNSCGGGSCCPSGLTCNTAANLEVAACCTSGDCRGAVEGAPTCGDSSWSLYKGLNGNGFCCQVGMIGVMDYSQKVAGSCVSATTAGQTTAQLVTSGSGSVATQSAAPVATTTAAAPPATTTAAAPVATTPASVPSSAPVAASSAPATVSSVASSGAAVVTASATNTIIPVASSVVSAAASGTSAAASSTKTGGAAQVVGSASLALFGVAAVAVLAL